MASTTLLWLRRSLRLADNPALVAACKRAASGGAVVPVFIWSPEEEGNWSAGAASRWWLHYSLAAFAESLKGYGSRLIVRFGSCEQVLGESIDQIGADAVLFDRCYEPKAIKRDKAITTELLRQGIEVESYNTSLLYEPGDIQNKDGNPYKVFTPFWRACQQQSEPATPKSIPKTIPTPKRWPKSQSLRDLDLPPDVDWASGLRESWMPGEAGAQTDLKSFLKNAIADYEINRDRPDRCGTSRLSPHLHFGEISPRQIWHVVMRQIKTNGNEHKRKNAKTYLRQLGWREFAHHLLYHFPDTPSKPLRSEFGKFPWRKDDMALKVWQRGNTGYPIVDAGMRELWRTGWMHNRVRMIVASFLVKDLLLNWRQGAAWFWDTLVDADLANNTLGWQWSAGCGADAAPYFRVFNPVLQGKKFDPEGVYVRRWVPELAKLDTRYIHEPWKAPAAKLEEAGIELGIHYPRPIVDHSEARDRALQAFDHIKNHR